MKYNIGIYGRGFVGSAVAHGMSAPTGFDSVIRSFDIDPTKATHSLEETISMSDFVFISVPTPANKDGSINLDILESSLRSIENQDPTIQTRGNASAGFQHGLNIKVDQMNSSFSNSFSNSF